jgi:FlgN protein
MGLADVANILWREREALDLLLFKLEEEQLVLATGRTRWLAHATREVEFVLDRIRQTELLRAVEVDAAAAELGLPPSPSLQALADAAPPPWGDVLRDHRRAFLALTAEITALAETNRELLTAGRRSAREVRPAVDGSDATYGRSGATAVLVPTARLVHDLAIDPVAQRFGDHGAPAAAPSGRLASVPETLSSVLPSFAAGLDRVASNRAGTVNAQHGSGFDLPKTIMERQLQQAAHQTAPGTTARVMQRSLTDFLRQPPAAET